MLPVTNTNEIEDVYNKEYWMNFAGQRLEWKEYFKLKHIHEEQKRTYKYGEYGKFFHLYNRYEIHKDSTLTLRLNIKHGEMVFLLILHLWNIYLM
jgi:hypothetical protein